MKLRIEVDDSLSENEVIIRCARIDDKVQKIQAQIRSISSPRLVFYKGLEEFYLPLEEILFFETEGEKVYAHTTKDAFMVKHRLYELEKILPREYIRISKATIANTSRIYAIERKLTSSSQIRFTNTHKSIYASRHYYNSLKEKMNERSK